MVWQGNYFFPINIKSHYYFLQRNKSINTIVSLKVIPLWTVEDVRYWFGVKPAECCWEIRVNPYQGIRAPTRKSTVQRYNRWEWNEYKRMYTRTNKIEMRIVCAVSGKSIILRKRRPMIVSVRLSHYFWYYVKI